MVVMSIIIITLMIESDMFISVGLGGSKSLKNVIFALGWFEIALNSFKGYGAVQWE